ncbi:MAG: haloacid dehalogenase-like hydrolase [Clostridia bacterium]|nr:haloacid dehalogenase-like hydrolase [Clostridia bacterium]
MQTIDVYDFDGTIYRGDSTVDFLFFVLNRQKWLAFFLVLLIPDVIHLCVTRDLTRFKSKLFSMLSRHMDLEASGKAFWASRRAQEKINGWFADRRSDLPVVIASASPDFELKWIAGQLGTDLICTCCDAETGRVIGKNCKSSEKIRRIREKYGNVSVRAMYTDNIRADRPLLELASEQYLVDPKSGSVTRISLEDYSNTVRKVEHV